MISELDSGWSSSGSNTGPMRFDLGHDSYNTSFYPVTQIGTGEFNAGPDDIYCCDGFLCS